METEAVGGAVAVVIAIVVMLIASRQRQGNKGQDDWLFSRKSQRAVIKL